MGRLDVYRTGRLCLAHPSFVLPDPREA